VIGKPYRSYVAIGDSLSEGLGDFTFKNSRHYNGWTDRLAGLMAQEASDSGFEFQYANLAIRGAKLQKIIEGQLPQALYLQPDLVTVMAGSNDIMTNPGSLPQLRDSLRDGIHQLLAAGCDVVLANTINPSKEDLHQRLQEITTGDGPDVIVEAVGSPSTYRSAVEEVAFLGRVVCIGYAKAPVEFNTSLFVQKEIEILGSRNCVGKSDFPEVLSYLESKKFPVDDVISKVISIDEGPETLKSWAENPQGIIKIMIDFNR
jgi:hypothetical protein